MDNSISGINFNEYIEKHSPGYVIEVFNNNKREEYVVGNRITKPIIEKATSDTLYDIASLTKVFTSVLVYIAFEEGRIDLKDKVFDIDNSFTYLKDTMIIDLLSHNQNIWTNGYLGSVASKKEFYDILYTAYVKENKPTYVDVHYIILGVLLEKIYSMSYEDLCVERIFSVLNMNDTTFNPNGDICASNNYEQNGDIIVDNIYPGLIHDTKGRIAKKYGLNLGHASIFTTGQDLLMFLESFFNYKLLKKETIELMLEHRNTNEENLKKLVDISNEKDPNKAYEKLKKENGSFYLPKTYNNMGTRYRNVIKELNDIPDKASDNSIVFSGYTGPMFTIDFDNKIIVLVMCNVMHNTKLNRDERKALTFEIINKIFNNLI